jgi:hypothetical protein
MLAWFGATSIGIGNAFLREATFGELSTLRAHQASTATLLLFLALYIAWLQRRRPLSSKRTALQIGALWAAATVAFEFALGLGVTGDSLSDLIHNYNFAAGRVWALVPLWMLIGPAVLRPSVSAVHN